MTRARFKTTTIHAALTGLRVVSGVVLAAHGLQKATDFATWRENVGHLGIPFPDVSSVLAVAGELGGGLGLIVGLLTPLAAFGALCTMVVAIFTVHIDHGLFAQDNGFEYPLTLGMVALFFMARGAGPWSLDALVRRWRRSPTSRGGSERPRAPALGGLGA